MKNSFTWNFGIALIFVGIVLLCFCSYAYIELAADMETTQAAAFVIICVISIAAFISGVSLIFDSGKSNGYGHPEDEDGLKYFNNAILEVIKVVSVLKPNAIDTAEKSNNSHDFYTLLKLPDGKIMTFNLKKDHSESKALKIIVIDGKVKELQNYAV